MQRPMRDTCLLCLRGGKVATETGIEQVTGKVIGDKVRESWVPAYTDLYMQFKGIYFLLLVSQD